MKILQKSEYLSIGEWLNKIHCIHIHSCIAIKRNELDVSNALKNVSLRLLVLLECSFGAHLVPLL